MNHNEIILYGIGGADTQFVAIRYFIIQEDFMSIGGLVHSANFMRMQNPTIEHVYAIDNRPGLRREYMESIKCRKNSIEARYAFRDTLERYGLRII